VLKKLNDIEAHVIAKDNDKVVAYLLAMTVRSQTDVPILIPMFEAFGNTVYGNKRISEYNYIVVGQACVDKQYRGQGVFDACYSAYRKFLQHKYDFAITEIASTNTRSLAAHRRVGFDEISRYTADNGVEWVIVVWDWWRSHQG
jgi:GNAT superfamily N-acetyltransferase